MHAHPYNIYIDPFVRGLGALGDPRSAFNVICIALRLFFGGTGGPSRPKRRKHDKNCTENTICMTLGGKRHNMYGTLL